MAYDSIVDSAQLDNLLTGVADAIREKTNTTGKISLVDMPSKIQSITVGTGDGDNGVSKQLLIKDIDRSISRIEMPASIFGPYAFAGANSLTTVTGTDGISYYGPYCFYECTSLVKIGSGNNSSISADHINIGTSAFSSTKLGNLDIKTATNAIIGVSAFAAANLGVVSFINTGDTAVSLTISNRAFERSSITKLIIEGTDDTCAIIDSFAFDSSSIASADFTRIVNVGEAGFRNTNLQSLQLNANLYLHDGVGVFSPNMESCSSTIDVTGVFAYCDNLTTVTAACDIPDYCFFSTTSLASVELQNGCTRLGDSAFQASGITSITIPITVLTVGKYLFAYSKLRTITCDAAHIQTSEYMLSNARELETVIIHNESNSDYFDVGAYTFDGCDNLVDLVFDINPGQIGACAFRSCSALPDQSWISDAVLLDSYSFAYCKSLKNITVKPEQQIKQTAFTGCDLDTITADERYPVSTFNASVDTYTIICENPDGIISADKEQDAFIPAATNLPVGFDSYVSCVNAILAPYAVVKMISSTNGSSGISTMDITHLVLPTYTTVAENTFIDAYPLQTVVGDSEIITIGSSAFAGLKKLTSVELKSKSSITLESACFSHSGSDLSVTLNATDAVDIGTDCFSGAKINCVNITDTVDDTKGIPTVSIGDDAFSSYITGDLSNSYFTILSSFYVHVTDTLAIGDRAFTEVLSPPDNDFTFTISDTHTPKTIIVGKSAFSRAKTSQLTFIAEDTITAGDYAFSNGPKSLTLEAGGDISLGEYSCYGSTLEECSITTPTTLTIGRCSFQYTSISELPLPTCESVVIADDAFSYCGKLNPYVEFKNYWQLGAYVFRNTSIRYAFNVHQLSEGTFSGSDLMYIVPSTDCSNIGDHALDTYSIKAVYIPTSVVQLGCILPVRSIVGEPETDTDIYNGVSPYIISLPDSVVSINDFFYSTYKYKVKVDTTVDKDGNEIDIYEDKVGQARSLATNAKCLRLPESLELLDFTEHIVFPYLTAIDFGNAAQMQQIFDACTDDRTFDFIAIPGNVSTAIEANNVIVKDTITELDSAITVNKSIVIPEGVTKISDKLSVSNCAELTLPSSVTYFDFQLGGRISEFIIPDDVTYMPPVLQPLLYGKENKLTEVHFRCSIETAAKYPDLFINSYALQHVYVKFSYEDAVAAGAKFNVPEGCVIHYSCVDADDEDIPQVEYCAYMHGFDYLLRFYKEPDNEYTEVSEYTETYVDVVDSNIKIYQDAESSVWYIEEDGTRIYNGLGDTPDTCCWAPLYEHIGYDEKSGTYKMNPHTPPMFVDVPTTISHKLIDAVRITTVEGGNSIALNGHDLEISTLQYRTTNAATGASTKFEPYALGTAVSMENAGDYVEFRNTANDLSTTSDKYVYFTMSGDASVSGTLSALINGNVNLPRYAFYKLFSNCPITAAPDINGFAASTDAAYSFAYMFEGCTKLTQTSRIALRDVGMYTFTGLYKDCTALTDASAIFDDTRLGEHIGVGSCNYMFYGCTALTNIPDEINVIGEFYGDYMFYGCTSITKTPKITGLSVYLEHAFDGCTALTQASEITAMINIRMGNTFENCTSLTGIDKVTYTVGSIYGKHFYETFKGCTAFNHFVAGWNQWADWNSHNNWMLDVQEYGTFILEPGCPIIRDTAHIPEKWIVKPAVVEGLIDDEYGSQSMTINIVNGMVGTEDSPIINLSDYVKVSDSDKDNGIAGSAPKFIISQDTLDTFGLRFTEDGKLIGTTNITSNVTNYCTILAYCEETPDVTFEISITVNASTTNILHVLPEYMEFVLNQDYSNVVSYDRTDSCFNGVPYYIGDNDTYVVFYDNVFRITRSLNIDDIRKETDFYSQSAGTTPNPVDTYFYLTGNSYNSDYGYMTNASVCYDEQTGTRYRFERGGSNTLYSIDNTTRISCTESNITNSYTSGCNELYGLIWTKTTNQGDLITQLQDPVVDGPITPDGPFASIRFKRNIIMMTYLSGSYYTNYIPFVEASGLYNNKRYYTSVGSGYSNKPVCIYYDTDCWVIGTDSHDPAECTIIAKAFSEIATAGPAQAITWDIIDSRFSRIGVYSSFNPDDPDFTYSMPTGPSNVMPVASESSPVGNQSLTVVLTSGESILYRMSSDYLKYKIDPMYWVYYVHGGADNLREPMGRYIMCNPSGMRNWVTAVSKDAGWECDSDPFGCIVSTSSETVDEMFSSQFRPYKVTKFPWDAIWANDSILRIVQGYDVTDAKYDDQEAACVSFSAYTGMSVSIAIPKLSTDPAAVYELSGETCGLHINEGTRQLEGTFSPPAGDAETVDIVIQAVGDGKVIKSKITVSVEKGLYLATYIEPPAGTTQLVTIERSFAGEDADAAINRMNDSVDAWSPYTVYDTDLYTITDAAKKIEAYKGYCSYCNYKSVRGPHYPNYYAYAVCDNGTKSVRTSYYYEWVPAPPLSVILGRKCEYEGSTGDDSYCILEASGYYDSPTAAAEAMGTAGGSCSCSTTATTYFEDTPAELQ